MAKEKKASDQPTAVQKAWIVIIANRQLPRHLIQADTESEAAARYRWMYSLHPNTRLEIRPHALNE